MIRKYVVVDEWNAVDASQVIAAGKPVGSSLCGLALLTSSGPMTIRWPSGHDEARNAFYKTLADMMQKVE